jgi:hypothetical protein
MTAPTTRATGTRLAHLDRLKVLLVALIIAAHGVLGYCGVDDVWPYQRLQEVRLGPVADAVVSVVALFGALFLMGLFLLVSGLLAAASIERKGAARFARDRLLRLGVPFAVWVLGVWPLTLVTMYRVVGRDTDYARMLVDSRLDTGPMWFVEILLLLSLGYAGWWHVAGRPAAVRPAPVRGRELAALVVVLAVATFLVRLVFPFQSGEWAHLNLWEWPQYVVLFGLGTVAARRGGLQPVPERLRRGCGIGALAATGGVVFLFVLVEALHVPLEDFGSGWRWPSALLCVVEATLAVCASVWLLAAAQRWLDRPMGRCWRTCSRSAYAAFVVQGPVLVALALVLRPVAAHAEAKAVVVAGLGLLVSFALGLLLVRLRPVGGVL